MTWWIYAIIGAVFLAAAVILEKKFLKKIHALEFTTELSLYGLLFSLVLLPWVQWNFSFKVYGLILLNGVVWSLAFLFFNKSLRHGEISEVSPLSNLKVITTLVFAVILLHDYPSVINLAGVFITFIGAYILELRPHYSVLRPFQAFMRSQYLLFLLLSVTLYGIAGVITKTVLMDVPVTSYIFFLYVSLLFSFLIIDFLFHRENIVRLNKLLKLHGRGLLLTSFVYFLARIFILIAVSAGSVTLVNAVLNANIFLAVLIGGTLFHEQGLVRRLFAAVLMIAGVALVII